MAETWVIKDNAPVDENSYELAKTNISFASGGANFVAFEVYTDGVVIWLKYYTTANTVVEPGSFEPGMGEDRFYWSNSAYKKLTFDTSPTGDLLTWLQANATRQVVDSGGANETWVIKNSATGAFATTQISFTSNGQKFTSIGAEYDAGSYIILRYDNNEVAGYDTATSEVYEFYNDADRKLTFDTPPTGALLTWLQSNATRQVQVVEYLTTDTDLIKVANAIRAKSGTTAKLSFPDGFALAISNISTVAPGSNYGLITYNGSELTIS